MVDSSIMAVHIVGGGLAGCEAALQLAERGIRVILHEAKPKSFTQAHKDPNLAELVCSNSLKSDIPPAGPALLKAELKILGSKLLSLAENTRVPAGSALAVDRAAFARTVTTAVKKHRLIDTITGVVNEPPGGPCIIATGPLSLGNISSWLTEKAGSKKLHFYDAIAPIVEADSLNMDSLFPANRRDPKNSDYLNSPLDKEGYLSLVKALKQADQVVPRPFEEQVQFDACQPIERIARMGDKSLAFGPFRPVGITNPKTGKRPYAVVQLRKENAEGTAYNLVGCQTRMTTREQKRVFRMLPGLEKAVFLRYGSVHRNMFIEGPQVLHFDLSMKNEPDVFLAGQLTGAEGYVEAITTGLLAAHFLYCRLMCIAPVPPPETTAIGGLLGYITGKFGQGKSFCPSHFHYGLLPAVKAKGRRERRKVMFDRAVRDLRTWSFGIG
ncbi:MAG: methylenetetrahydrofolate--tRNA-(uracil(54)-C(5))-methyltransferase (FADH(2)-oxidizing) TrmFO [Deltaproteobacteria bacterium]|nr:methylenetetrahydrofolate--tRNA-(uracil(54)-C(5))-methyltransferase (FADH(2)-oxidizing) TrmFO [Deltaproteobacteria bacterium]